MPIDEDCVNTIADIVSDIYTGLHSGFKTFPSYRRVRIEPITSYLTPEDVKDVTEAFSTLEDNVDKLYDYVKHHCKEQI
jgi:hypothetical protein